jgi:23S rRNA (adenine2030-N6)-methyltransferase
LNYRHAFYAGNFTDRLKHAVLVDFLLRLAERPEPLLLVDTHAGAGLYDLKGPEATPSPDVIAGIAQLIAGQAPPVMEPLRRVVAARNPGPDVSVYPGSPVIMSDLMRPQDRLVACELRSDDHARLQESLAPAGARARTLHTDGYAELTALAGGTSERLFALIDPPFERADDYVRVAETIAATLEAKPDACLLVWVPLKDLETFDACVRRIEAIDAARMLIGEVRLRPLSDPMRLNGCAVIAVNAPAGAEADIETICDFVAAAFGEVGAQAKVWRP